MNTSLSRNRGCVEGKNHQGLQQVVARGNQGRSAQLHTQVGEIDYGSYQETVSAVDEHVEEGAVKGDRVPVEL